MSRGVRGREFLIAERASRSRTLSKLTPTRARKQKRLPTRVNLLVLDGSLGEARDQRIRIVENGKQAALLAVCVGIIAEPGVPQRIAIVSPAMLAIALLQRIHSSLTSPFPAACADRDDRATRLPGS